MKDFTVKKTCKWFGQIRLLRGKLRVKLKEELRCIEGLTSKIQTKISGLVLSKKLPQ